MRIIDSHTHIDFDEFDSDRQIVIQKAIDLNVSDIVVSSTIAERWHLVKQVCDDNHSVCHPAYGLHPMFMHQHKLVSADNDIAKLQSWLQSNRAVALGEVGLDFFIEEANQNNREAQIKLFVSQLEIAEELQLPVIIHARKSMDTVLKHLRSFPSIRGSIHSFSGSEQQAKQLIDLGYFLSFGGPITYDRATRLHKLIKNLPIDCLLVETDSPDQSDASHHSQRNEPAYIHKVIEKIADIKNMEIELIASKTADNATELFKLGTT